MHPALLLAAFQIVGTFTSLIFKGQSRCVVEGSNYNHPFMQSMTMYIGEALCMFLYIAYITKYRERYQKKLADAEINGKKTKINPLLLIIPTSCDFVTSTLSFFALEFMPTSLYSMVRGGGLIITTLFSVIFLKRKLYRHHYLGLLTVMIGITTAGVVVTLNSSSGGSQSKIILGIILLVCSFITFSSQIIIEEKFFHQYELNPFQTVGLEGCWGILICGVFVAIFNYVPCPSSIADDCPPNKNLEDVPFFFQQVFTMEGNQPALLILILFGIILILFFNAISLAITKYVSSLARNVAQVCSPFFVWMGCLILGWETFLYGQLIGYVILAIGTMIFYEIIVIPIWGFNQNTKKAIEKRKEAQNLLSANSNDESTGEADK
ncbi:nucleotide-sugar transporter (macronuclear) [Tetrahymena thermophila SB210]|uniref:Nucleotide-sugar transporter n=1 Tax=Tetrahymena thermophila (strain SB210) TaxID=312017 RepID=I7MDE3_TETTS|nr:nucleotide-sugar transporter [Tetrahymena thermophila SB210]EAR87419.1 nucleotide-sugar transporter [Tetrahymena thermophila SB210]|eukprot:XP_001007664.1 nucleotide-sugar transporter [Tetrahymena thermophila SB210]